MYVRLVFGFAVHRTRAERITPHSHNCHELVFYDGDSKGVTEYGEKSFKFSGNGIALIKKWTLHSEEHLCGSDVFCIGFDTDMDVENVYVSDMGELKEHFTHILDEVHEQAYGFERIASCRIEEILIKIMRKVDVGRSEMKTLAHCKQYIKENFMQNIKISDVAAVIGYSPDHFRHLFKKTYGMSPQEYLIEKRLNTAYGALLSTEMSFSEIAELSGFSNLSQFTRMIKARYGRTPTRIRNGYEKEVTHIL